MKSQVAYRPSTRAEVMSIFKTIGLDGQVLNCDCGARRWLPRVTYDRTKALLCFLDLHDKCTPESR